MLRRSDRGLGRYAQDLRRSRLIRVLSALFPVWVLLSLLIPTGLGALVEDLRNIVLQAEQTRRGRASSCESAAEAVPAPGRTAPASRQRPEDIGEERDRW